MSGLMTITIACHQKMQSDVIKLPSVLVSLCRYVAGIIILATLQATLSGCAASSAAIMDEERVFNTKPIAHYKSLRIHEFELNRDLVTSSSDAGANQRERRYLEMPRDIAATVEQLVAARQIFPTVSRTIAAGANSLVLKGSFTRISRFRVSVTARLYDGENGTEIAFFRLTLWDVYDTSKTIELLSRETADFIDRIQYK